MNMLHTLIMALVLGWTMPALAGLEGFDFSGQVDEDRYKELIAEVRCLVCQNQSLSDSDAELAHDLRQEVYDLMLDGKNDNEIIDFLVYRYGDFVLYSPPVKPSTYGLWYGPFILLLIGIYFLYRTIRQRRQQTERDFSAEEEQRLKKMLGEDLDKDKNA